MPLGGVDYGRCGQLTHLSFPQAKTDQVQPQSRFKIQETNSACDQGTWNEATLEPSGTWSCKVKWVSLFLPGWDFHANSPYILQLIDVTSSSKPKRHSRNIQGSVADNRRLPPETDHNIASWVKWLRIFTQKNITQLWEWRATTIWNNMDAFEQVNVEWKKQGVKAYIKYNIL